MSETGIFIVGLIVFLVTTWGAVMAGGVWLAESDDRQK
jgi:hypothetical protein